MPRRALLKRFVRVRLRNVASPETGLGRCGVMWFRWVCTVVSGCIVLWSGGHSTSNYRSLLSCPDTWYCTWKRAVAAECLVVAFAHGRAARTSAGNKLLSTH